MGDSRFANCLRDLTTSLKEDAIAAKADVTSEKHARERDFALGRATAYYEVLSLIKQQAQAFGIALEDIALAGFDPEDELLSSKRSSST